MLTISPLNDLPSIRHAFFTRQGGVSEGIYSSLNCGLGSDDKREHVMENRARAMARLDLAPDRLATVYQVHSAEAATVTEPFSETERPEADGLVTDRPGIALGISTADCVPVLLADGEAGVIGAAHAGWRGALDGILQATVAAMEALGARPESTVAGIGPAISQRSYEVGPEFPAPFLAQDETNAELFCPARRAGYFYFDLKIYVARRLANLGLATVEALPCDTCSEETRFFSYRRACQRGESDYGRLLSVVTLES